MKIEFEIRGEMELHASAESILAALADVPGCAALMPAVNGVLHVGTHLYHWEFREREVLGQYLTAEAILAYHLTRPNCVSWSTLDGNYSSVGEYQVIPTAIGCRVRYAVAESITLDLPPVLRSAAALLSRVEAEKNVRDLLQSLEDLASIPQAPLTRAVPRGARNLHV